MSAKNVDPDRDAADRGLCCLKIYSTVSINVHAHLGVGMGRLTVCDLWVRMGELTVCRR